ncbi:Cof-type HAD-IIB family hydrolase [Clostridium bowmanii]|uniref:Cof-type HAD-IIB family hydrolase n=1 Tax=Clostridium bowmanii TaxID=132925 RepID=UPI001C0AD007|nr:Cof-type HAD-IIB family hydrolase [Clostridium bowmanii]MBU3188488.1 Cof-type HAD-IIB family hydrolase [Clostridium bowmanii]MCA1072873.1 Cof-type HAD-IIB family hydrolase [Clostridium bowmanii]
MEEYEKILTEIKEQEKLLQFTEFTKIRGFYMYKLLAIDMDGTLLNDNKKISKENILAIKKATQLGIKIVIASGRTIQGIEKYLKELDLVNDDEYCVVCSGALVMNNTNEKVIQSNPLSYDEFKYVFNLVKKLHITLNMYSDERILINSSSYYSKFDAIANNIPLEIRDFNYLDKDTLITKIMLINEDLSIVEEMQSLFPSIIVDENKLEAKEGFNRELFKDMSKLPKEFLENFTVSKVTPFNVEVMKKNISKRTGLEKIARELKIKPHEIICIGDSGNDKEMIQYAGLGVAMGNAFPEIKEIADYITCSNEDNGVAHVIEKFILNQKEAI